MVILTVGLEDYYPKYGPEWDQDACSELVNRIGKKLELIGRMDIVQMTDVLMRAEGGGFIRWHKLATLQEGLISSTYRNLGQDIFSVIIHFQEHDSAMNLFPFSMDELGLFVRAFGDDLEQLRKLTPTQVNQVGYGLFGAGFVKVFGVPELIQDNPAASPENCYADASQPTPSTLPPPDNAGLPADNIRSTWDGFELWMDSRAGSGDNKRNQTDWLLYTENPEKPNATQPYFGIASPGNTSTPGLEAGASCYPTPLTICQSPDDIALLLSDPSQVMPPQAHSGRTSPLPTFTPGSSLGYPTPSTICVETPRMREHSPQALGATMASQAGDMNGLTSSQRMLATTGENGSHLAAFKMLQSCKVALGNDKIRQILKAEAHLLPQDLGSMLRPLFDHWDQSGSLDLHALGLPVQWKGIQAAVDYLRVLDADARTPYLNPVAKRIGFVLLYLNYEELCKCPAKYCSTSPSKRPASHVLECILRAYPDDPRIDKPEKCRRNKITTYYVRRGKWWWMLAGNWGVGILLAGDNSPHDVMCIHTFTEPQIQVFVAFVQKTRPGTIRIFQALEPVVKLLMFGRVTCDLRKVLFDEKNGLLRSEEMVSILKDDERALASHWTENSWKPADAKENASQKLTELLS